MPGPVQYRPVERYFDATEAVTPENRARAVLKAIQVAEKNGQTSAGTFSSGSGVQALLNSRGVFAYYKESASEFSITTMGANSSGWAKKNSPDVREIDAEALAVSASRVTSRSHDPEELAPGKYVTILEP